MANESVSFGIPGGDWHLGSGVIPKYLLGGSGPMTCKWIITMVIVSPLSRIRLLINGGRFTALTNHVS